MEDNLYDKPVEGSSVLVYRHRRLDTNEIFYIGIGKTEKRAYSKYDRNKHWRNTVNKYGYSVEIVTTCESWKEACDVERYLIKFYGRRDLGTGTLVNMTDGGDGLINPSEESKLKMSIAKKGLFKGEKNPMYGLTGEKHPRYGTVHSEETKRLIGEKNPRAKKIINTETGVIYDTIKEASEKEGFKKTTLWAMLKGQNPNKTNLKLYE